MSLFKKLLSKGAGVKQVKHSRFSTFNARVLNQDAFDLIGQAHVDLCMRTKKEGDLFFVLTHIRTSAEFDDTQRKELGLLLVSNLRDDDVICDYGEEGFKVLHRFMANAEDINIPYSRMIGKVSNLPTIEIGHNACFKPVLSFSELVKEETTFNTLNVNLDSDFSLIAFKNQRHFSNMIKNGLVHDK